MQSRDGDVVERYNLPSPVEDGGPHGGLKP
jgi:hypothetical protein